ncbi:MAG: hypothetical protein OXC42_09050 [Gammaproteobacteria bacterium]|nr:hypothetical protein [Gammaproteobacteria bacterium]
MLKGLAGITAAFVFGVLAGDPQDIPPPKENYDEETLCVEPVEDMRRQHFEYILDHRDKTVVEGIRTKQYSLIGCIDCHITPNEEGVYARYSQETHFCASCHQFAAVRIDCFQCHADRPAEAIQKAQESDTSVQRPVQELRETLELSNSAFNR